MDLLEIDDQHRLSFREGTMNMLVLGGIGRGKTTNFMQPVVQALIAGGHAGLIVDVKNNFASKVRRMAAFYGREQDVIEIGNRETATPINIVRGLSRGELKQILKPDTANLRDPSWALGGWKQCCDVIDILHFTWLKSQAREFDVSLAILSYFMNDITMARKLYDFFKSMVYDATDFEQFSLVERIHNEMFHMLNAKGENDEHYSRHIQWELITIREILRGFAGDEQYINNFSCPDGEFVLDFRRLLHEQNKIVVLRFDNNSSDVGRSLAALAKMKLYADIYRSDPEALPKDRFTFQVVDEFQDVFHPEGSMGDLAWFAKSREFNHINVISCQSLSSLYRGAGQSAVHELVTNCSCKAILQTEDLASVDYFKQYPMPKPLIELSGSEAYFSKFDLATRSMATQLVDLTEQHARSMEFQDKLARLALPDTALPSLAPHKEQIIRLRSLIGMPAPWADSRREDNLEEERVRKVTDEAGETISIITDFDEQAFMQPSARPKKQKLTPYEIIGRKIVRDRFKAGRYELVNPGGFLRMDRKAIKLQARQTQREAAKALARARSGDEALLNCDHRPNAEELNTAAAPSQGKPAHSQGIVWNKATESERLSFMEMLLRQTTGEDAGVELIEENDAQPEDPAIVADTGTNRKQ